MATIMRTKIGDGLRDPEKLTPVNVDYSEQALQTVSSELNYCNVILQDMSTARALKRPHTKFSITQVRRGVAKVLYEGKVGNAAAKLRWSDLAKLWYCQAITAKPHTRPIPERAAIKAFNKAAAFYAKHSEESYEAGSLHGEVFARYIKHLVVINEAAARRAKHSEVINEAAARHAKHNEVIAAAFGLLKDKEVLPLDALQFEREMRDE